MRKTAQHRAVGRPNVPGQRPAQDEGSGLNVLQLVGLAKEGPIPGNLEGGSETFQEGECRKDEIE